MRNINENTTKEEFEYGKNYETKYLPEPSSDYENFSSKAMQDFYSKYAQKHDDANFDEFISKKLNGDNFNSIFSIKSTVDFFAEVPDYYNPFRLVSTRITTSADSVEVPALGAIQAGWDNSGIETRQATPAILVRNFPIFAKMELPKHFLNKVESNVNYLKTLLGMQLAKLERRSFLYGDGAKEPLGILMNNALQKSVTNTFEPKLLADELAKITFKLKAEYRHNACFMMSSDIRAKLTILKDDSGRYIFSDNKLFGYTVYTIDELKEGQGEHTVERILFGNFKYGHLICDGDSAKVISHDLFDRPNSIGLSLPTNCGAALVCPEAIYCLEAKVNNAVREEGKESAKEEEE